MISITLTTILVVGAFALIGGLLVLSFFIES